MIALVLLFWALTEIRFKQSFVYLFVWCPASSLDSICGRARGWDRVSLMLYPKTYTRPRYMNALFHFQGLEKNADFTYCTASHQLVQVPRCLLAFPSHLALCQYARELLLIPWGFQVPNWCFVLRSPPDSEEIHSALLTKVLRIPFNLLRYIFHPDCLFSENRSFSSCWQHSFTQDSDQNSLGERECVYVHKHTCEVRAVLDRSVAEKQVRGVITGKDSRTHQIRQASGRLIKEKQYTLKKVSAGRPGEQQQPWRTKRLRNLLVLKRGCKIFKF